MRWRTPLQYGCAVLVHFLFMSGGCYAQWFLEDAQLVDARVGNLSGEVDKMAHGTGLLSDGSTYSFERWYGSNWKDVRFTWITPITRNFGVYWGFGTGEHGEKYRIEPSLKLGFLATRQVTANSFLSLSASFVLGGYLKERSCTADYGAIGGIQDVNCRLADSLLPPAETLQYLRNDPPGDQVYIVLRYQFRF